MTKKIERELFQAVATVARLLPKHTGCNDSQILVYGNRNDATHKLRGAFYLSFSGDFRRDTISDRYNVGVGELSLTLTFPAANLALFERWLKKHPGLRCTQKSRVVSGAVMAASLTNMPIPKGTATGWPNYMLLVTAPMDMEEEILRWRFSRKQYASVTLHGFRRRGDGQKLFDDKNYSTSLLGQRRKFEGWGWPGDDSEYCKTMLAHRF